MAPPGRRRLLFLFLYTHIATVTCLLRPPIELALPEDIPTGMLTHRIQLSNQERIKFAPIVKPYLTIHANGSIGLHRHLNYEVDDKVMATVMIENLKSKGQCRLEGAFRLHSCPALFTYFSTPLRHL